MTGGKEMTKAILMMIPDEVEKELNRLLVTLKNKQEMGSGADWNERLAQASSKEELKEYLAEKCDSAILDVQLVIFDLCVRVELKLLRDICKEIADGLDKA